jgi:hypothetical protein
MKLPKDVAKYASRKVKRCVAIFSVSESIALLTVIFSWDYFASRTNPFFHTILILVLCITPFIVAKFPWSLFDKSWEGVVTEVYVKDEMGSYAAFKGGQPRPYPKYVIYLKVRTNSGEEKRIAVREFGIRVHVGYPVPNEGDVTKHIGEYSVGDRVYHFYGLEHYYIQKQSFDMVECVVCGTQNHKDRDDCIECGHSIIK